MDSDFWLITSCILLVVIPVRWYILKERYTKDWLAHYDDEKAYHQQNEHFLKVFERYKSLYTSLYTRKKKHERFESLVELSKQLHDFRFQGEDLRLYITQVPFKILSKKHPDFFDSYHVSNGKTYHLSLNCPYVKRGSVILKNYLLDDCKNLKPCKRCAASNTFVETINPIYTKTYHDINRIEHFYDQKINEIQNLNFNEFAKRYASKKKIKILSPPNPIKRQYPKLAITFFVVSFMLWFGSFNQEHVPTASPSIGITSSRYEPDTSYGDYSDYSDNSYNFDAELEDVPKTNEITGALSTTVYWTPGGGSYHFSINCTSLKRSKIIYDGTLQDALNAGKTDPCNLCAGGS